MEIASAPKQKIGFFKRNRNKITRGANILVNLAAIIGIAVSAILHLIAPPLAFLSIPSVITLVVHWASKNAPETLEDIKKLFLSSCETETDRESVSRAYEEILGSIAQTERTTVTTAPAPSNEPIVDEPEESPHTQRLPVKIVWNTKTNKPEYAIND